MTAPMDPATVPELGPSTAPTAPAAPVFGIRLATGLAGVLVAAMMSGLNNRVGALGLVDVEGALGLSADAGHLLGSVYAATELAAMPISAWFAITLSFRRFHMGLVVAFMLIGILLPLAPSYGWLIALRGLQGLLGGAMIPLLMAAALRFLPPSIKLHGLGLYSLTATFVPSLAIWIASAWVDDIVDWRLIYWEVLPAGLFALWSIWWGIPQDPVRLERFGELNRIGIATGPLGLALVAIGLEEGERLDWLHSPAICGALFTGTGLLLAFLVSECFHPMPFIRFRLLERRNFYLGLPVFVGVFMVVLANAALPAALLVQVQGFRPREIAPVGLIVSLPQLVLAPITATVLYRPWLDARHLLSAGLLLIAAGCWLGSYATPDWMAAQFWTVQACEAVGQAFVIISLLLLLTGIVVPTEGPFVSGLVNMLRVFASMAAGVLVESGLIDGMAAHIRGMVDRAGSLGDLDAGHDLLHRINQEALTLAVADIYRVAALLAVALVVPALLLDHVAPPSAPKIDKGLRR